MLPFYLLACVSDCSDPMWFFFFLFFATSVYFIIIFFTLHAMKWTMKPIKMLFWIIIEWYVNYHTTALWLNIFFVKQS